MIIETNRISKSDWTNWNWQLRNRLDNRKDIRDFFPNIGDDEVALFNDYKSKFQIAITPYVLSLIELDDNRNPAKGDPIWEQFKYFDHSKDEEFCGYDQKTINWELPEEMPTRILQHKYPDRAIIRITDQCFGNCNYCYLTMRTLDVDLKGRKEVDPSIWEKTLEYIDSTPKIRDILISGGDPLLLSNSKLRQIFEDLRNIKRVETIRLNTRAVTHNPFRFDEELLKLFKEFSLTVLEIHIAHPREITEEFDAIFERMDKVGYHPIILWRSPLLRGVNNSYDVLEELFVKLYQRRIIPYYLFHYAPYALGRSILATSVREGVELMLKLRRQVPGIAFPRYTLFHPTGKRDIPLELNGTPTFIYKTNKKGYPIIEFKNWKGEWVIYPDVRRE
ncbi:MAG: radical SAM protein [Theionarchaea archaeon]|nr:MAG: hypothetical protein AYK19_20595 [Theionarchaea archaeon DG-70-1]MBU7028237.1 radical SAM protein [Theionarchaea archaeon]